VERRVWRVEVESKQRVVEYRVKAGGDGEVLVDGVIMGW
jgi:hypothetical protein